MKLRKVMGAGCLMLVLTMNVVACGKSDLSEPSDIQEVSDVNDEQEVSVEQEVVEEETNEEEFSMDDIAWSVDESIVDGKRTVALEYANNSEYPICTFEVIFKEKSGLTQENKDKFYTEIQEKFDLSEEDATSIKEKPIAMHTETQRVVMPGESVKNINCYYFSGYFYLRNIEHFNLVEPDIATIKYVKDDEIYTIYYDFASQKYSTDDKIEKAYQWTENDLGDKAPKPEVIVLEAGLDSESIFMFDAYGLTLEEFNAYVDQCKEQGYTVDENGHEGFYSADNAEGYNVYLNYNEDDYEMSGSIKIPEE